MTDPFGQIPVSRRPVGIVIFHAGALVRSMVRYTADDPRSRWGAARAQQGHDNVARHVAVSESDEDAGRLGRQDFCSLLIAGDPWGHGSGHGSSQATVAPPGRDYASVR